MNSGFAGQVGQESHLHPAVVEPAALRSGTFSNVQERTRAALKSPILMAQSIRKFTNVHRRWDQHWVKPTKRSY